jgi:hypothetical protein
MISDWSNAGGSEIKAQVHQNLRITYALTLLPSLMRGTYYYLHAVIELS